MRVQGWQALVKLLGDSVFGCTSEPLERSGDPEEHHEADPKLRERLRGFQRILQSDAYAGKLTVFLDRGRGSEVFRELLQSHDDLKIERQSEIKTKSIYQIEISSKEKAETILKELINTDGVSLVYPNKGVIKGSSLDICKKLAG